MEIDPDLEWLLDAVLDNDMPTAKSGQILLFIAEKAVPPPTTEVVIEIEAEEPPIDDLWGDDWGETTVVDVGMVVVGQEVNGRRVSADKQPVIG